MFPELICQAKPKKIICFYKGTFFRFLQSLFPVYPNKYQKSLKTSHQCQLCPWYLLQYNSNWKIYDCRTQSNTLIYFNWNPHNKEENFYCCQCWTEVSLFHRKDQWLQQNIFCWFLSLGHEGMETVFRSAEHALHWAQSDTEIFNTNGKFCKLSDMNLI